MIKRPSTPEMDALLKAAACLNHPEVSQAARIEVAKALALPLREGVFPGNIVDGIFEQVQYKRGQPIEYVTSPFVPGTEKEYVAFTTPSYGAMPQKFIEADYVTIPTYEIGAVISVRMRLLQNAQWDQLANMMKALEAQIVKKQNDDAWHLLLATAADRNVQVFDSNANSGQFTKRIVSLAKTVMGRNAGGNSTSVNHGQLTDLYMSPEGIEDMRNWGIDQIDEVTRREIYVANDTGDVISRVFGVNLHPLWELGEGQEYQQYFLNELGAALQPGDLELLIGMDLSKNDSFINPIVDPFDVVENPIIGMQRGIAYWGYTEMGWAALDNRRIITCSM